MSAVRVSKRGRSYEVTMPADFDPERKAQVSESVRATLESRRPTLTREHTAQLVATYRHRAAGKGVDTRHAASTWIREMGYNSEAQQATIVMNPSKANPTGAYVYDMDPDTWGRVASSSSVGKAYNTYVRRAGNTSVDVALQCEDCGRYYGSATEPCLQDEGLLTVPPGNPRAHCPIMDAEDTTTAPKHSPTRRDRRPAQVAVMLGALCAARGVPLGQRPALIPPRARRRRRSRSSAPA